MDCHWKCGKTDFSSYIRLIAVCKHILPLTYVVACYLAIYTIEVSLAHGV